MFIDIRSDYSLLSSLLTPEVIVEQAQRHGWKFVGIADDKCGGLLDCYLEIKQGGLKPVIGLRVDIANSSNCEAIGRIILYPVNFKGYQHLLQIISKANLENKSIVALDGILEASNLLCVMPVAEGCLPSGSEPHQQAFAKLRELFGKRLYMGLLNRNTGFDDHYLQQAGGFPYLRLSGVRYVSPQDRDAYKVARAIHGKCSVERIFDLTYFDESLETAIATTTSEERKRIEEFVEQINLEIPTPGLRVPKFKIPEGFASSYDYLVSLCRDGFKKKGDLDKKATAARMSVELDVVKRCELADYFLLIYDICKFCDEQKIPRGTSRGSAGGCLISFLLDITRVDPLKYGLLFERFLNEDRTRPSQFEGRTYLSDAPDIDLDVSQIDRHRVVTFLQEKYGFVSKISTFTTMTTKAVLKDVIRAHCKTENEASYVADMIEVVFGKPKSIDETLLEQPKFREWAGRNQEIVEIAKKLENLKKNNSVHAAGLVVSDEKIENYAPLILAKHGEGESFKTDICCAYSLDIASQAGLIKFDLLGLRTLSVLEEALQ